MRGPAEGLPGAFVGAAVITVKFDRSILAATRTPFGAGRAGDSGARQQGGARERRELRPHSIGGKAAVSAAALASATGPLRRVGFEFSEGERARRGQRRRRPG